MPEPRAAVRLAYETLAAEDDGRVCRDISDEACNAQPQNFLRHAGALGLSKAADGLSDPKLVLSWLMTHLGAPAALVGLLVPIREAGSLLPQLFTAARIRAMARRKWAWAGAALGQGAGAAIILLAALLLEGLAAGLVILAGLAVLALSRSVASVAYKDVLGKTIDKGQRGTVTGLAASWSSVVVIGFALVLIVFSEARFAVVLGALALAAGAWVLAGVIFAGLAEDAGASDGGANGWQAAIANLRYLREDPQLARFITARGLLTATALAPPWLVVLAAGEAGAALEGLGTLVLASALAGLLSGYVWGRLADRSSRRVLIWTGISGAAGMALTLGFWAMGLAGTLWAMPLALFWIMVAHQGVRLGRSTYLVDMVGAERRAVYTAIANTVIGVILLASGVFGAIAGAFGAQVTLALFAAMALAGAWVAYGLKELGAE
ncbi:MFS transporter [Rhodobacteraceae bacterium 2376]|uniref:MFS transporter n=1 Tax=Rhabdonatronobacter sediminivivens TaxID=2743469 RepID=A0A7Z0I1F1_9RHOB|nr:MFS transporter [Rhabdonatronobacter sediminivivens]NYS25784.1 MFS transporter [Rhabdonatronobacter sediminivivens]